MNQSKSKRQRVGLSRTVVGPYFVTPPGSELKWHDTVTDFANTSATGDVETSLNRIVQGILDTERTGRKIVVKHIHGRGAYTLPKSVDSATAKNGDILRMIVYLDKQANAAAPDPADILTTASYSSHYNMFNQDRFEILADEAVAINYRVMAGVNIDQVTTGPVFYPIDFSMALDVEVEFDDPSGDLTTIMSNNIGILFISRSGIVDIDSVWRTRFRDR